MTKLIIFVILSHLCIYLAGILTGFLFENRKKIVGYIKKIGVRVHIPIILIVRIIFKIWKK